MEKTRSTALLSPDPTRKPKAEDNDGFGTHAFEDQLQIPDPSGSDRPLYLPNLNL